MLARLLEEHEGAARADFLRLYGLDLEEVPISDMAEMIAAMPRGTRTLCIVCPQAAWTDAEYLLANICDQLNAIAYGLGGGKGGKPKPMERPGAKAAKPKHATLPDDEILNYINGLG